MKFNWIGTLSASLVGYLYSGWPGAVAVGLLAAGFLWWCNKWDDL